MPRSNSNEEITLKAVQLTSEYKDIELHCSISPDTAGVLGQETNLLENRLR